MKPRNGVGRQCRQRPRPSVAHVSSRNVAEEGRGARPKQWQAHSMPRTPLESRIGVGESGAGGLWIGKGRIEGKGGRGVTYVDGVHSGHHEKSI